MKNNRLIFITAVVICGIFLASAAICETSSRAKEDMTIKSHSMFQTMADFITGNYDVKGEPIKKTGVFQPIADDIKNSQPVPVR